MDFLRNKKLFILEWNSLDNPGKMKNADIEDHMVKKGVRQEYLSRLMNLRISSLTMDLIKELEAEIAKKQKQIAELEGTTATNMYQHDLESL